MNKLEDKLAASLKPAARKTPAAPAPVSRKPASAATKPRAQPPAVAAADDLDTGPRALHPARVWPD